MSENIQADGDSARGRDTSDESQVAAEATGLVEEIEGDTGLNTTEQPEKPIDHSSLEHYHFHKKAHRARSEDLRETIIQLKGQLCNPELNCNLKDHLISNFWITLRGLKPIEFHGGPTKDKQTVPYPAPYNRWSIRRFGIELRNRIAGAVTPEQARDPKTRFATLTRLDEILTMISHTDDSNGLTTICQYLDKFGIWVSYDSLKSKCNPLSIHTDCEKIVETVYDLVRACEREKHPYNFNNVVKALDIPVARQAVSQTFKLFTKLPIEVQDRIWELSIADPQVVQIYLLRGVLKSSSPPPPALSACKASRAVCLRSRTESFQECFAAMTIDYGIHGSRSADWKRWNARRPDTLARLQELPDDMDEASPEQKEFYDNLVKAQQNDGKVAVGPLPEDPDARYTYFRYNRDILYFGNRTFTLNDWPDMLDNLKKFTPWNFERIENIALNANWIVHTRVVLNTEFIKELLAFRRLKIVCIVTDRSFVWTPTFTHFRDFEENEFQTFRPGRFLKRWAVVIGTCFRDLDAERIQEAQDNGIVPWVRSSMPEFILQVPQTWLPHSTIDLEEEFRQQLQAEELDNNDDDNPDQDTGPNDPMDVDDA